MTKKRLFKIFSFVLGGGGVLVLALLAGIWYATSTAGVRRFVLPQVQRLLKMPVKLEQIALRTPGVLTITGVKLGDPNAPLLACDELAIRYNAGALLKHRVEVDKIGIKGLRLLLDQRPDGTFGLPEFAGGSSSEPSAPAKTTGAAWTLHLKNFQIADSTVLVHLLKNGQKQAWQMENIQVALPELVGGKPFALTLKTRIQGSGADAMTIGAAVDLELNGKLDTALLPENVRVKLNMPLSGQVGGVKLDKRDLMVSGMVSHVGTEWQVKDLQLVQHHAGRIEGRITASARFGTEQAQAQLAVEQVDQALLNLVGHLAGDFDFGQSRMDYHGKVDWTQKSGTIGVDGRLELKNFSIASVSRGIPAVAPVALSCAYEGEMNTEKKQVLLKQLAFRILRQSQELATVQLRSPLTIPLGKNTLIPSGAALDWRCQNLDLAMAAPFLPADSGLKNLTGLLSGKGTVRTEEDELRLHGDWVLAQAGVEIAAGKIQHIQLQLGLDAAAQPKSGMVRLSTKVRTSCDKLPVLDLGMQAQLSLNTRAITGTVSKFELHPAAVRTLPLRFDGVALESLNFARTRIYLKQPLVFSRKDGQVQAKGRMNFTRLQLIAPQLGVPQLAPVNGAVDFAAALIEKSGKLRLHHFLLDLNAATGKICRVRLNADSVILPGNDLPLKVDLGPLNLSFFASLLKDAGVDPGPEAQIQGGLAVRVGANFQQASGEGAIRIRRLAPLLAGYKERFPELELACAIKGSGSSQGIDCRLLGIQLRDQAGTTVSLQADGHISLPLSSPGTVLHVHSDSPIEADKVLAWLPPAEEEATEDAEAVTPPADNAAQAGMQAQIDFALAEIRYCDTVLKKLQGTVRISGDRYELLNGSCSCNDAPFTFSAKAELPAVAPPVYAVRLDGGQLDLVPLIHSFAPEYEGRVTGKLDQVKVDIKGQGADWEAARKALAGQVVAKLRDVKFSASDSYLSFLLDALLLRRYHLSWDDLAFQQVNVDASLAKAQILFSSLLFQGQPFRLTGTGSWELGGKWYPDMQFVPAFRGQLAESIQHRMKLEPGENGYFIAHAIALKGNIYDKKQVLKQSAPELLESFGVLKGKDAARVKVGLEALDLLKNIGGKKGKKKTGNGTGKALFQLLRQAAEDKLKED